MMGRNVMIWCSLLVILVPLVSCQCSSGISGFYVSYTYAQSYRSSYRVACGLFGWFRCTQYRTRYRTGTGRRLECCSGYKMNTAGNACVDIDECMDFPCENGGSCINLENELKCICLPGWTGEHCEIDECMSSPCKNGGSCMNLENEFICICLPGWTGVHCEIDIDECSSSPCLNGGSCMNRENAFSCICSSGWTGVQCDIGFCASTPCQHEALCVPSEEQCRCPSNFTGRTCEIPFEREGKPMVTHHPQGVMAELSGQIILTCRFKNVVHFNWWKDGIMLADRQDSSVYKIDQVEPSHQGYYHCVGVADNGDTLRSNSALLKVPYVSIFPISMSLRYNYTASLADQESTEYNNLADGLTSVLATILERNEQFLETPCLHVVHFFETLPGQLFTSMNAYVVNSTLHALDIIAFLTDGLLELATLSEGKVDPSSIKVESSEICLPTTWSSPYGMVNFSTSSIFTWRFSTGECPWYTSNATMPIGIARCTGDYIAACTWILLDNCGKNLTQDEQLVYLQQQGTTGDIAARLTQVSSIIQQQMNITSTGVTAAVQILENAVNTPVNTVQNAAAVVSIISNIADIEASQLETSILNRATLSLENILISLNVSNSFGAVAPNVAVQVTNVSPHPRNRAFSFASFGDISSDFHSDNVGQHSLMDFESIGNQYHPSSAIVIQSESISEEYQGNLAFTIYRNDALFISDNSSSDSQIPQNELINSAINTHVIACSLENPDQSKKILKAPVMITLTHKEEGINPRCVFWNYSASAWSTAGCQILVTSDENHTDCVCDHLTNFAVLMELKTESRPNKRVDNAFIIIRCVGCSITTLGLLITLTAYISHRNLRRSQPSKIMMCLFGTLFCLYIFFIAMTVTDGKRGVNEVPSGICGFIGGILHFTILSSLIWMGVEGISIFLTLTGLAKSHNHRLMLKAAVISFGLPALVVIVTGAASHDQYVNVDYCFLQKLALVLGLLVPVILLLLTNMVIFALVIYQISKTKSDNRDNNEEHPTRIEAIRRLNNAVILLTLASLTWIVGYLTTIYNTNLAAHIIFVIFNSLQGSFIILFYCVRQPDFCKECIKFRAPQPPSITEMRSHQGLNDDALSGEMDTPTYTSST